MARLSSHQSFLRCSIEKADVKLLEMLMMYCLDDCYVFLLFCFSICSAASISIDNAKP